MKRIYLLACLFALPGCDDGETQSGDAGVADAEPPAATRSTFALDGVVFPVGVGAPCADPDPAADPALADWAVVHVDPAAAPGGDGSADAPFATVASALLATEDAPTAVILAPGVHLGSVEPTGPTALLGRCSAEVRLEGPPDAPILRTFASGTLIIEGIHLAGGSIAVDAQRMDIVALRDVSLTGSSRAAMRLRQVALGAFVDSTVRDQAGRGLVALESGLAVVTSEIGPGIEVGVLGAADPDADTRLDDCEGSNSPVCPLAAAISVDASWIHDTRLRGIDVSDGAVRVARSLVEGVAAVDGESIGVRLGGSLVYLDQQFTIRQGEGLGLALDTCRGVAEDIRVEANAGGGIGVGRAAGALPRPAWGEDGPGWRWPSAWLPESFVGGAQFPGWEWLPRPDAELPPGFRRDAAEPAPELALHRWARVQIRDSQLQGNARFGIRAEAHVLELVGGSITDTQGANSAALAFGQPVDRPVDADEVSAVVLSRAEGVELRGNEGLGVVVSRAALFTAPGLPWTAARVQLEGLTVADSGSIGVALLETLADVQGLTAPGNRGVGLWSAGSFTRVRDAQITDTAQASVPGREGPIDAADGMVLQGTERFSGLLGDAIDIADTTVTGSGRAGVLIVADEPGLELGGVIDFAADALAENAQDAVILGVAADLQVDGVELTLRTAEEVPPPALPLPGLPVGQP